jgi:iron complex transport system permease protein
MNTISAASNEPSSEPFDPRHDPLRARQRLTLIALSVLIVIATLTASAIGALSISFPHILAAVADAVGLPVSVRVPPIESATLFTIRLPRVALGLGAGATLGLSGAVLQALFRNPLADPALIGVSGGAACGAVGSIVLGVSSAAWLPAAWAMPLLAFVAALAAAAAVYGIAQRAWRADVATLLLAGLAVNALTGALVGYLSYIGTDSQLRALTFWLMGGLSGATWPQIWPALLIMGVVAVGLLSFARRYDVLALGDSGAGHLGLKVETVRQLTIGCVALGAGASVALTGIIGFVGLIAPHLVRLVAGATHRFSLPASALMGALLLVLADLCARTIVAPAELPVGIVTSALGAPLFIQLLRRRVRHPSV